MSVLIRGLEMPKEEVEPIKFELYADGTVIFQREVDDIYEFKAIPVHDHGRLIDADEFLKRAIGTKCFREDYALMLEELVGESTTIIPAEDGET